MVSNSHKLVMAVLLFFLALTYVRGIDMQAPTEIVIQGDLPLAYGITFTNPTATSVKPLIVVDGPLIVESGENQTVPPHEEKEIIVYLSATPVMKSGEVYSAQLRVITPNDTQAIPLTVTKNSGPIINPNPNGNPSPGAGFVGLISANAGIILNAFLIIVIVALLIALFSRIKNRVGK